MTRAGFTLVELMVVMTIIAALSLLILPAVQAARESARRARCSNNLRSLGTAILNRESSVGTLPDAFGTGGFSVHAQILPYIEQVNLANSLNYELSHDDRSNFAAYDPSIPQLLCPSDDGQARGHGRVDAEGTEWIEGWTNYAGNAGFACSTRQGIRGAFDLNIRLAQVSDGTSNTAAMAEWVLGPGIMNRPSGDALADVYLINYSRFGSPLDVAEYSLRCDGAGNTQAIGQSIKGNGWIAAGFGSNLYNHVSNINRHSCLIASAGDGGSIWTAGSRHGRVANVLFIDGHVRALSASITPGLWTAFGSRDGAEIILDQ